MRIRQQVVALLLLFAVTPLPPIVRADDENLLDKLYRLIWPLGRFEGSLVSAVVRMTEKAGDVRGRCYIYLINALSGEPGKWTNDISFDPVVCPNVKSLFYLRGVTVVFEAIKVDKSGIVRTSQPQPLEGIKAGHLYACTEDEPDSPILWVQAINGDIRCVGLKNEHYDWVNLPLDAELAKTDPREIAEKLSLLHSIRPDGYHVFVRNHKLVGQRLSESSLSFVGKPSTEPSLRFSGSPAWVGDSDYLFTTAAED